MNDESETSTSPPDQRPPGETAAVSVRVHKLERGANDDPDHYVSPHNQALEFVSSEIARGAEFVDMGTSSLGVNLNLTDDERDQMLDRLDDAIDRVTKRALAGQKVDDLHTLVVEPGSRARDSAPSHGRRIDTEALRVAPFSPEEVTLLNLIDVQQVSSADVAILMGVTVDFVQASKEALHKRLVELVVMRESEENSGGS